MPQNKPSYQDLEKLIIELKSENELLQKNDRFSMLLKGSDNMITVHKPCGKYIYFNGPKHYDISYKEIVGKYPKDLFSKDIADTLMNSFKKVHTTGHSETREVLLEWEGEKKWFSEYIYPLKDEEGRRGFRKIEAAPDHYPYGNFCVAPGHQIGFNDLKAIEINGYINAIMGKGPELFPFRKGARIQHLVEAIQYSSKNAGWLSV